MNRTPPPFDLPRLVMRHAFAAGLLTLLLAAVLGLMRVNDNIEDEVDAAMSLATTMARLGSLDPIDDLAALAALRETLQHERLRHLTLHIVDEQGRVILQPPPAPPDPVALGWLYALHRQMLSSPDGRCASWSVARPNGGHWIVSLAASHESERIEALNNLAGALALLLGCTGALLLAMAWNVRRAFAPLAHLLSAIGRVGLHDHDAVRQLPRMPIQELESVANALRALVQALDRAESERRLLSQQVLTLQEDERNHLARELHDEFGQRLTALRLDAVWLGRRLAEQPSQPGQVELQAVVGGMAQRCAEVQQDIRDLLVRLRPLGPIEDETAPGGECRLPYTRMVQLLEALVSGWQDSARSMATATRWRIELRQRLQPNASEAEELPLDPLLADTTLLPSALVLAVYRISQEALTNAARHASASEVVLSLTLRLDRLPASIDWSVRDDGIGLPDPAGARPRGNGLGGMQERVWALGGQWSTGPATRGHDGRPQGLALCATLGWSAST